MEKETKEKLKKKSRIEWLNNFIGIEGLFRSGKYVLLIILSAMAINYWLQFAMAFPKMDVRPWLYAAAPLIPLYLVFESADDLFDNEKGVKE